MSLKVLLVSPPVFDFYYSFHRSEPLGLLYIREALLRYDWLTVDMFDARCNSTTKMIPTPHIFDYLKHIYVKDTSWFSLLYGFKRYGYSFETISKFVKEHAYDVVCISSLFSAYHHDVELLVKKIKEETGAIVIVGGWAVWAEKTVIENGSADFYISGDGDVILPEILREIDSNNTSRLPKLITTKNSEYNEFFVNSFPSRRHWYTYYGARIANIICSKGCVYRCDFCSIHCRYRYYQRNFESIEKELEYLYAHGVKIVNFEDDNFLFHKGFALQLLSLLKYYHKKGMHFLCMNGVTAFNLHSVLDDALNAGFLEFNLSLVSSQNTVVAQHHRPDVKEIIKTIAKHSAGKVKVVVYLIAGLPGSTVETCVEDILFLAKLPVLIGFSPLYMLPGLELFDAIGLPKDRRLCRGSALYYFGDNFSREDIAALWKLCRFINRVKNPATIDAGEMKEHSDFYKKSCREKVWYFRDSQGKWYEGFQFNVTLPQSFKVYDIQGNEMLIL